MNKIKMMLVVLLAVFSMTSFASNERPLIVKPFFKPAQNIVFNVLVQVPCDVTYNENGQAINPRPYCAKCYTVVYTIGGGYTYSAGGNCSGLPILQLRFNVDGVNEENDLVIKGAICDYLASDPAYLNVPCP